MSSTPNRRESSEDGFGLLAPVSRGLLAIRRSFLLFVAFVGVILILIGVSPLVNGLFAGMFAIWGVTALVCAGLGFVIIGILQLLDT